ncbi:hypothetical protein WA1_45725 [Scytonema hofmannii PCC 7110]|uniref:Peptidase M15A C-terminal domain-containing protein n=1 Tax=Scytonema hofmannii PCC 7110 TaxID=128403 RepID=A0A139WWY7_9CYAN|nr:D-Ala-D-Ala carboxypeptidase family metallohydrolase [Scytonema hofmannii]KYC36954.1 hypothetical protein WA1_45725 [Scytonema hofmannii PCC 7110]
MGITIDKPQKNAELELEDTILFEGTSDPNILQVELWTDDRWLLGKTSANNGKWSLSYSFNSGGTRQIVAKGFDTNNQLIASDNNWLFLKALTKVNFDMNLSKNFKLWEFVKSTTADLRGIDNTPTSGEIQNLKRLCQQILQPARDALGPLKINSGFRSEELNRVVGGVSNSDHRQGFAADVIPVNVGTKQLAKWVNDNCEFDQIILEFGTLDNPSWIHLSAEPRNRKQVLRATSEGGSTVYTNIQI